jgi:hypothetical protein
VQQAVAATSVETEGAFASGPLAGKAAIDGKPTAYACLGPTCSLPVTEPAALVDLLLRQRAAS